MFWKKASEATRILHVYAEDGSIVFADEISSLAFRDSDIRWGSMEFYNDPEPCEIHRRAVALRFYAELEMILRGKGDTLVSELPSHLRGCFEELHGWKVCLNFQEKAK